MSARRMLLWATVVALTVFLATGCGGAPATDKAPAQVKTEETPAPVTQEKATVPEFMLGSAGTGGYIYMWGTAAAKIINDFQDRVHVTNQVTVGSGENLERLKKGELKMGIASNDWVHKYCAGIDVESFTSLRTLYLLPCSSQHIIVRANSPYKSIWDLRGKRVAIGPKGGGTYEANLALLDALGIGEQGIKPQYLSQQESADAIIEGTIDAWLVNSNIPTSGVTDAATRIKIRFLSLADEDIEKVIKKYPFYVKTIMPSGSYPNQDYDVQGFGRRYSLLVTEDFPEEYAYAITKTLFEHDDELVKTFAGAKGSGLFPTECIAPLHPGAEKVAREAGLLN